MPPTKRLCSLDDRGPPEASGSGAGCARELFQQLLQVTEDFFRGGCFLYEFQSPIGAELCAALRSHESRRRSGSTVAVCRNFMLTCSRLRSIAFTPTRTASSFS